MGFLGLASFYGPAYAERAHNHPRCEVGAAAEPLEGEKLEQLSRPTRDEFSDRYGCPVYERPEAIWEQNSLDAVVVATPTTRRANDVVSAIERQLPVLSAKPLTGDPDRAHAVAEASEQHGVPTMTTSPARFDDTVMEMGNRVRDGVLGNVLSVRASIRHDRVPERGIDHNAEHGPGEAGPVYSMSFYTADAILWLADAEPTRVYAEYSNVNSPHSAHPDLGSGTVYFDDGTVASMTLTYCTDCREPLGNWEIEVVGEDGILRNSHQGYEGFHWGAGAPGERKNEVFGRSGSPILDRQFEGFVRAVESGDEGDAVPPSPNQAARAIELCAGWEESAQTNRPVRLNPS